MGPSGYQTAYDLMYRFRVNFLNNRGGCLCSAISKVTRYFMLQNVIMIYLALTTQHTGSIYVCVKCEDQPLSLRLSVSAANLAQWPPAVTSIEVWARGENFAEGGPLATVWECNN